MLSPLRVSDFQHTVMTFYAAEGRSLPWRVVQDDGTIDPYSILVSEMMLQQTQVARVIPKYEQFMQRFPDIATLADASLADVLEVWHGLGYNRRARYVREAAKCIVLQNAGAVPSTVDALVKLPGVGANTAAAIIVYAFNTPRVFIETNIRTVYLHHFFQGEHGVTDAQLLDVVQQTVVTENPREWYWALMDYGSWLKRSVGNPNSRSKHYAKQSPFDGSTRMLRGVMLRLLSKRSYEKDALLNHVADDRAEEVLAGLIAEKLVKHVGTSLYIAD